MSRVEDEAQAKAAADAERLQKKIDRDTRDSKATSAQRETFAKMMKGGQTQQRTDKSPVLRKEAERQGAAQQKTASDAERKAQMARGGLQSNARALEQAKSFQGGLSRAHSETQQSDAQRTESRDTGVSHDRVDRDERGTEQLQKAEVKKDQQHDLQRIEAREPQHLANAAIDGNGQGGGGGGNKREHPGAPAHSVAAPVAAAAGPSAAHEVKQIPPELLEKLVSTVYLAVNQKGLREFQIELKEGVLSGATLKISADDGKISLRFIGLDAQKQNLIESSKGELMRKLEKKGLRLARLDVG